MIIGMFRGRARSSSRIPQPFPGGPLRHQWARCRLRPTATAATQASSLSGLPPVTWMDGFAATGSAGRSVRRRTHRDGDDRQQSGGGGSLVPQIRKLGVRSASDALHGTPVVDEDKLPVVDDAVGLPHDLLVELPGRRPPRYSRGTTTLSFTAGSLHEDEVCDDLGPSADPVDVDRRGRACRRRRLGSLRAACGR